MLAVILFVCINANTFFFAHKIINKYVLNINPSFLCFPPFSTLLFILQTHMSIHKLATRCWLCDVCENNKFRNR